MMLRIFEKIIIFVFFTINALFAQTNLSGNIGGMILEKTGNPFIVGENITIPSGKKLTVEAGCIFLFNPFTGINVEGNFEVKGTTDDPVIFTSFNNQEYNPQSTQTPNPFDWNGIHLKQSARDVHLSHFILEYSVFGLKSQISQLMITQGNFNNNGQFDFTIDNVIQPVTVNIPFNYGQKEEKVPSDTIHTKNIARWPRPLAIGTGITGLGGLGAMGYFFYMKNDYKKKYDNSSEQSQFSHFTTRQEDMLRYALISGISGGVLLTTGVTIYTWDAIGRKKSAVSYSPLIGEFNGLILTMRF